MKKLGLIAALAMCVTVGGVYATWDYANTSSSLTVDQSASTALTGMGTAEGETLKIKAESNNLVFKIDDTLADGSEADHIASRVVPEGSITVVYDVVPTNNEAVTIYCNVTVTNLTDKKILKTTLGKNALTYEVSNINGTDVEWTVNASDLLVDLIPVAEGGTQIELPTKAKYNEFSQQLSSLVSIDVRFSLTPIE